MTQYEFSEKQNKIIGQLALWMVVFGVLVLIHSVVIIIIPSLLAMLREGFALSGVLQIFVGLIILFFGLAFLLPTDNLRRIVKTQGNDIDELMAALGEIARYLGIALIMAAIFIPVSLIYTFVTN